MRPSANSKAHDQVPKAIKITLKWGLSWFELAGVSWSEFGAGITQAQLGRFQVESGGLNLAETRVRSVPGEGLEPSRGKPSQDFKSWKWDF